MIITKRVEALQTPAMSLDLDLNFPPSLSSPSRSSARGSITVLTPEQDLLTRVSDTDL